MRKLLTVLLTVLSFLSGCTPSEEEYVGYNPVDEPAPVLELDETVYEFNEITNFMINNADTMRVIIGRAYKEGFDQSSITAYLGLSEFVVDYGELTYDYVVNFTYEDQSLYVFVEGDYDNAVLKLYGDDNRLYSSIGDITEISLQIYDGVGAQNIDFDSYNVVSELDGYSLHKLHGEAYSESLLPDYNPEIYVWIVTHPDVWEEVYEDGELIMVLVEFGKPEYMTTTLKYPFAVYYVEFEGEKYSIIDPSIPIPVLEQFIKDEDELFLFTLVWY